MLPSNNGGGQALEPYKKRRWRRASSPSAVPLFTCARPGRSKGSDGKVPDSVIDLWVRNLPGPSTAIVSLLGKKPGGLSEFSFYSFHGRESFQEWLGRNHSHLGIRVVEHGTTDFHRIDPDDLAAIASHAKALLSAGHTVVIMDSGGETRTRQVCQYMGFIEDTR